jgi:hypothetical protein
MYTAELYWRHIQESEDLGEHALYVALVFQALFIIGVYFHIPLLVSKPIFFAQIFVPAFAIVMAESWGTAFVFGMLCALVVPFGSSVIYVLYSVTTLSYTTDHMRIIAEIGVAFKASIQTWIPLISKTYPGIAVGVGIRFLGSLVK